MKFKKRKPHKTNITDPDYIDNFCQAGVAHTSEEIQKDMKENYTCRDCGITFTMKYLILNTDCKPKGKL